MTDVAPAEIVPDSEHRGLVARLPQPWRNLALLARFDRPIGWWLLFWPCAWGALLAGGANRPGLIAWLCDRSGLRILGMKRIRVGRVALASLPVGQWRFLAADERF